MSREYAVDTFTGLFDSLQRSKRDGSQGILSGCEAELQELMRQIDIMVNAKKVEWDSQLQVLQLHVDKKKKEAGILKIEVGAKTQEVENLKHQITAMDHSQRDLINEYEDKLSQLRDEVNKLRRDHEKLQKKSQKHNNQIQEERDKLRTDLHKRNLDMQRVKDENEDIKMKLRDWDSIGRTYQDRLKTLETENLTMKDKNNMLQTQSKEIQDMLSQRKHTLENLEKSHQIEITELENQIAKLCEENEQCRMTSSRLQDALDDRQTSDKETSAKLAYMDGRLRHAHEVVQTLEREKEQLQRELNSKCDLLKALEEKQRHQREDLSNLEKDLYQKEGVIRDLRETGAHEESSAIKRLREDLQICHTELSSKKETEKYLRTEIERLTKSLMDCEAEFRKSNIELIQKHESLTFESQDEIKKLVVENTKLKDNLQRLEDLRSSEVDGMKSEIKGLTADLHQRDQTIASMSEKMKKMEKDLRDSNSEYDQGMAHLHVVKGQLEALRLENHHLQQATMEGEIRDLDRYHNNQRIFDDLQDENINLRVESAFLREDLARATVDENRSSQHDRRPSPAEKTNIPGDIRRNTGGRESLRFADAIPEGTRSTAQDYFKHHQRSSSLTTSQSESDDPRRLSFGDLKGPCSDYEQAGSPSNSRRSSITANFVAEETRREKELERILNSRLDELKLTTKSVLGGYPRR